MLTDAVRTRRVDLASPTSAAYLDSLAREQAAVADQIRTAIPDARVRWRYSVVANGLAVVVRPSELAGSAGFPA